MDLREGTISSVLMAKASTDPADARLLSLRADLTDEALHAEASTCCGTPRWLGPRLRHRAASEAASG
jgi:hypothetical protein